MSIYPDDFDSFATASDADREYARNVGQAQPDVPWILSDRDVWYPNPFYVGPVVPHPENEPGSDLEINPDLDFLDNNPIGASVEPMEFKPMCWRCFEEDVELFPANCAEKPELLAGAPLGQYHCPDCGAMVCAGIPHGDLCQRCIDRKHPNYD